MHNPALALYNKHAEFKIAPSDFPPLLRQIADPPKSLFVKGDLRAIGIGSDNSGAESGSASDSAESISEQKFLCVVGSRRNSVYGKEVCERLIGGLAGYPVVIVSGLAYGIDSIAHRVALEVGLRTVAVPGSGLDASVLYPRAHFQLACSILSSGGALVTEYDTTLPAGTWTFPRRNRIMAGLSHALLVIEAEKESGTAITARLALDYNRDVLAVPGSIFSQNTVGAHRMIRDGARPVISSLDILEVLGLVPPVEDSADNAENEKTGEKNATLFNPKRYHAATPAELSVLKHLTEPLPRQILIEKTSLPAGELNALLGSLELKGYIRERAGEFSLK